MTTTKSILKEQSEMMLMMKSDIREMKLYMEAFMKALMTEGASFPVVIVKDETKECKSEEPQMEPALEQRKRGKKIIPKNLIDVKHNLSSQIGFTRINTIARNLRKEEGKIKIACEKMGYQIFRDAMMQYYIQKGQKLPTNDDTAFWAAVEEEYNNA